MVYAVLLTSVVVLAVAAVLYWDYHREKRKQDGPKKWHEYYFAKEYAYHDVDGSQYCFRLGSDSTETMYKAAEKIRKAHPLVPPVEQWQDIFTPCEIESSGGIGD